MVTLYPIPI